MRCGFRNHILDAAVTDLLAAVHLEEGQTSVKEAVEEITSRLRHQDSLIKSLHEQLTEKVRVEGELRSANSVLTDQLEHLKRALAERDDVTTKQRETMEQEVTQLKERLQEETTGAFGWRKRYLQTQAQWTERSGELEAVVRQLRHELSALQTNYKQVESENAKSKVELQQMSEKTRKLLTSLDLANECADANVALDFARSVSYTRRRRSGPNGASRPTADASPAQQPQLLQIGEKSDAARTSAEKSVFRLASNHNTSVSRQQPPSVFERRRSLPQHRSPQLMTSPTLMMTSYARRGDANGVTSQSQRFLPPIDDREPAPDVARVSLG